MVEVQYVLTVTNVKYQKVKEMKHVPGLCISRWRCCLGAGPLGMADVHGPRVQHVDHTTRFTRNRTAKTV